MSIQNRQPAGRPTGGQFAATERTEPAVRLSAAPTVNSADLSAERDAIRGRLERIEDAKAPLDHHHQRLSARTAAAAIREIFPGAASYTLQPNEDGERQLDLCQVLDAEGKVLADVYEDDEWTYETVGGDDGPELAELTLCLDMKGWGWADGIADEVSPKKGERWPRATWKVDIDRALAAQDASLRDELDPTTRTLTPQEQAFLIETARTALYNVVDQLNVHYRNYTEDQLEQMRRQRDQLADVVTRG